jgi:hypothetical protein
LGSPAQTRTPSEVSPDGGNMGIKVARVYFANIAKKFEAIETDMIPRELMWGYQTYVDQQDKLPQLIRHKSVGLIHIITFYCKKRQVV